MYIIYIIYTLHNIYIYIKSNKVMLLELAKLPRRLIDYLTKIPVPGMRNIRLNCWSWEFKWYPKWYKLLFLPLTASQRGGWRQVLIAEDTEHLEHRIWVIVAGSKVKPSSCGLVSIVSESTVQISCQGEKQWIGSVNQNVDQHGR